MVLPRAHKVLPLHTFFGYSALSRRPGPPSSTMHQLIAAALPGAAPRLENFRPVKANPGTGLLPPLCLNVPHGQNSQNLSRGNQQQATRDGTQAKNFISAKSGWVARPSWGDLSILQATLYFFPFGRPFAGRSGAVSGPQRRRFIFPGEGLGAHFRVQVPSVGEVG
jgi:hypothetical protein